MSSRSTNQNEASADYIDKYIKTMILNGQLQILDSSGTSLYKFQGSEILDDINVILPLLSGDDTFAFQNFNNEFGGIQTFNAGIVSQGGLFILPDPEGLLDDDITLFDDININLGSESGTTIATSPTQLLGFFGATPTIQPTSSNPDSASLLDLWNMAVTLGLISGNPITSVATVGGVLPSQVGGKWGLYQGVSTTPSGDGLLSELTKTSNTGTLATTFINNRPAMNIPSGSSTNNWGGFRTTNTTVTVSLNPTMTFKVAMSTNTTDRLLLGLASSTTLTNSFNTALNNISGIMIGFGSGDANYSVITNNGGAAQTNNTVGMPALQTAGTTTIFKLSWNNATTTLTWSVQTATNTITTGTINTGLLPASGTQMYFYCTCQTNAAASVTMIVEDVELSLSDYALF